MCRFLFSKVLIDKPMTVHPVINEQATLRKHMWVCPLLGLLLFNFFPFLHHVFFTLIGQLNETNKNGGLRLAIYTK